MKRREVVRRRVNNDDVITDSEKLALCLVRKMVGYEREIDSKPVQTQAEKRHVAFLRALRVAGY